MIAKKIPFSAIHQSVTYVPVEGEIEDNPPEVLADLYQVPSECQASLTSARRAP